MAGKHDKDEARNGGTRQRSSYEPQPSDKSAFESLRRRENHSFSPDFLACTRDYWQPKYPSPLTDNDAQTIANNVSAFLELLEEWDRKE